MIPDEKTVKGLWDRYHLPPYKRIHCETVGKVALMIAKMTKGEKVNEHLLVASALLHDIDKNIEKLAGEQHPDTGVRVLKQEGMDEVAEVIRTHPLHMILDEKTGPITIEQQVLFIADKMTKQDFIGLEKRFDLWRTEDKDEISRKVLDASYPKAIALRDEILGTAGITEEELILLLK